MAWYNFGRSRNKKPSIQKVHFGLSPSNAAQQYRFTQEGVGSYRDGAEAAEYARDYYPALSTPAGVQAVRLIANTISGLECYIENRRGSRTSKPEWVEKPIPRVPEVDFKTVLNHVVASLILEGTAYVGVRRAGDNVKGLVLVEPQSVSEVTSADGNTRRFSITRSPFGSVAWNQVSNSLFWDRHVHGIGQTFVDKDMLVWLGAVPVPGSARGISAFDLISDTLGIARAVQKFAHEHYELYAHRPSFLAARAGALSEDEKIELESDWQQRMIGKERGIPKALFSQGMPAQDFLFQQVGDTPTDVSVTDISAFAMSQIAMAADVPLALIGGAPAGGSSYNSLKIQKQHWLENTVIPMVRCVEKTFDRLLPEGHHFKLDVTELSKGDIQTTAQVVDKLVMRGVITGQEGREMLGYEPIEEKGADMLMVDANRVPLKEAIKKKEPKESPPNAPPNDPEGQPGGDQPENQPASPQPEGRPEGS